MYTTTLAIHSIVRWLVLLSLLYAIYLAARGYFSGAAFTRHVNAVRHWTATFSHIQLVLGFIVYAKSPVVAYFFTDTGKAMGDLYTAFFGLIHVGLMLAAIVVLSIGSAKAKRQATDSAKFRTMLIWFAIALLIMFIAIPWPFSPLASRPYFPAL